MKVLKFLKSYGEVTRGEIREVRNDTDADHLVAIGTCVLYTGDDADDDSDQVYKDIEKAVKKQLRDEMKTPNFFAGGRKDLNSESGNDSDTVQKFWTGAADSNPGFDGFGDFLCAVKGAGSGEWDGRLKGLTGTDNVGGGFTVPDTFIRELYYEMLDIAPLFAKCKHITIDGSKGQMPFLEDWTRSSGRFAVQPERGITEGTAMTEKTIKFGLLQLILKKSGFLVDISNELMEDSGLVLSQTLPAIFGEIMGYDIENQILRGAGAGEMLGMLNSANPALISVTKETDQPGGTITFNNVLKMYARATTSCQRKGIWLANRSCVPQLYSMSIAVGTGGGYVLLPADAGAVNAPPSSIFGRPLYFSDSCPALGDANDFSFVNPSAYVIAKKSDEAIKIELSEHVKFSSDEVQFRVKMRLDGQPMQAQPITPRDGGDTISNFVGLEERV